MNCVCVSSKPKETNCHFVSKMAIGNERKCRKIVDDDDDGNDDDDDGYLAF